MAAGQGLDEAADLGDLTGVEPDGRLVENQHLRVAHEGLGQAHPLPVALREIADDPMLHVADEALVHHLGHGALRPPVHPFDLGHEIEIGPHPQIGVEGDVLRAGSRSACARPSTVEDVVAGDPGGAALAGMKQARMRMVVDLPAPFGPRKPTIWPGATSKETSRIAATAP